MFYIQRMDTRVFAVKTKKTAPQNNPRVAGGQTVEEEEECDDTVGRGESQDLFEGDMYSTDVETTERKYVTTWNFML